MTLTEELSCRELVELVTSYLEAALSPADHARFEAHLAGCRGCRAYLDHMRRTLRLLGTLTDDSLAPAARHTLLQAFRDWKRG